MTADRIALTALAATAVWALAWYGVIKAIDRYEWNIDEMAGEDT